MVDTNNMSPNVQPQPQQHEAPASAPAPQPAPAQTPPPPHQPVAPASASQYHPDDHHSHTGIYVALGIIGVLLLMCLIWTAFAYFSPRGAWSPIPGIVSDYQFKQMERQIEGDIKNDEAPTNDSAPDTSMSEIPDANGNYISIDQAVETARAKVGQDSVYSVEFDRINDKAVYVVDLNSGTTLYEVIIDATTGDVLNVQSAPITSGN